MITRISLILFILLIIPAWYIDRTQLRNRKKTLRIFFWFPNLLLALLTIILSVMRQLSFEHTQLTGLYLIFLLCLSIPETVYALFSVCGRIIRRAQRLFNGIGMIAAALSLTILICGYTLGSRHIVIRNFTHTSPLLPKTFNGFRIAQISDLHLGTFHNQPDRVWKFIERINQTKPDLIVFTGDMVNFRSEEAQEFIPILSQLKAPYGVISILGNHDYMSYVKWPSEKAREDDVKNLINIQRGMKWKPLLNENIIIRQGTDSIAIIGVENDGKPPFPQRGDLKKAQKGLSRKCFKILLSHDPTHWRRRVLPETDIPLMLAGHTHGMQFKIGRFSPASWFYPEWGGKYREGKRELIVSLGMGEVLMPFRFGAWPEIDIITLQCEL